MAHKTLYRSRSDRKFSGLVGGLAEYSDMDVNFLRLITLVVIVFSGFFPGLLAYLIAAAVVPFKPEEEPNAKA